MKYRIEFTKPYRTGGRTPGSGIIHPGPPMRVPEDVPDALARKAVEAGAARVCAEPTLTTRSVPPGALKDRAHARKRFAQKDDPDGGQA